MNKEHIVLVGSAGTGTAFAAICALRRTWNTSINVMVMDVNPSHLCTASLLADSYERVPFFADPKFPLALEKIISLKGVDSYLPLFPTEIEIAARMVEQKPGLLKFASLIPNLKTAMLCNDKARLNDVLTVAGIPVPKTSLASQPFPSDVYFIKPRSGTGSIGARPLTSEELGAISEKDKGGFIVQEMCNGPEITVDAFSSSSGSFIRSLCRERIETKSGVATKCRVFYNGEAEKIALNLSNCLGLKGSFCFQLMRNSFGNFVVTDVNPRPGAATAMSVATGNDFFAATFANAWGKNCESFFRDMKKETFVTRQYTEFVMSE